MGAEDRGKAISAEKLAQIQSQGSGVGIRGARESARHFGRTHADRVESQGHEDLTPVPACEQRSFQAGRSWSAAQRRPTGAGRPVIICSGERLPALMRILIADDNREVRRGVAKILSSRPSWEICGEAQDGAEAIQKATELLPDLILLDLSMPGLSGVEVAQALRETVGNAKIVIMSQHDPTILLPIALQTGAHACIDKSRLVADLVPTLEKIQRNDRPAQG
jgi:CheY-like chemotaxis protein